MQWLDYSANIWGHVVSLGAEMKIKFQIPDTKGDLIPKIKIIKTVSFLFLFLQRM